MLREKRNAMGYPRRYAVTGLCLGLMIFTAASAGSAFAEEDASKYPARAIHLVVGFAAGGGNDIIARIIGQWLSERLGQSFVIERVRLPERNIAIEGTFAPPQLAALSADDQVFVAAFVRSHGSIKEMEQAFGVSYPTIKGRLNRIAAALSFIETDPKPSRAEVLERLRRGEINADEAIAELEARK